MRAVWKFLKKLGIQLPYDPAIPLLGIHREKTIIQRHMYSSFHRNTICNIRTWKQPRCPLTDEWIKKCGTYTQWNIIQPQKGMN